MRMHRAVLLSVAAVAMFAAASTAKPSDVPFKYPAFAMVRGSGLPATVILGRGVGGIDVDLSKDSLGLVFDFSTPVETAVDTAGQLAVYEMAGFYGPGWSTPDHTMRAGVRFEEATMRVRIVVLAKGNMVLDAYGRYRYYALGTGAMAYLRNHGIGVVNAEAIRGPG